MRNFRLAATALVLAALAVGCSGDGPTDPDGVTRTVVLVSGNNQTGSASATLADPLVVRVEDGAGAPVSGETVSWAVTSSPAGATGAAVSASTTTTGATGETSVTFTLGSALGTYQVRASITGSSVPFRADAASSGLEVISGGGQVGATGATLPQPMVFRVVGGDGLPQAGVEVSFSLVEQQGSGASVSPVTATTGADGRASTSLTLGDRNGRFRVRASAAARQAELTAHACGGDPTAAVLSLAAGQDTVLAGPGQVGCVELPAHAAGDEYEVVVTTLAQPPDPVGFTNMELSVLGTPAGGPQVVRPVAVDGARSGSFSTSAEAALERRWRETQYGWDRQLRELEAPLRPQIQANAWRGGFGLMAVPAVGDTLDLNFSCITAGQPPFPNAPDSITAVVQKVTTRAVVIEDTAAAGSFTDAEYQEIADTFDNLIFAADTTYFGVPGDVNSDGGRIWLLYSAGVNRLTEDYSQGFIAGFFCPLDLGFSGGNNAEMFYLLVPDPNGDYTPGNDPNLLTKDVVRRITDNTVAHEFQHLINAQIGGGGAFDVWLNEGLSHIAEEIVGHAATGFSPGADLGPADLLTNVPAFNKWYIGNWVNLGLYLESPSDTAALVNSTDPLGMNTFRMRGSAWSFVRYLLDRFDTGATEAQRTRQLVQSGAAESRAAVSAVFGTPFNTLAADWMAMFSVEDRSDLDGPARAGLELTSYQLRAIYDDPIIGGTVNPPTGYPLVPATRSLASTTTVPADLFTATPRYVTLSASTASGGTALRLQLAGSGNDVPASAEPRIVIVRTKGP